ncbi:MAG TPA: hypothetical protein VFT13_02075 [Candidatus Krumholzibacteria bacterium]|nr:hypothetical protein [Candidatus Krumholzibacteria bacterium]
MSPRQSLPFILAGALALASFAACGDDDSPTGGGGGGGTTLSIPAGTWGLNGEFFQCGSDIVAEGAIDTLAFCVNEVVDDFFGYDCPIKRTGNNLSMTCERTFERSTGCNETVRVNVTGTVTGDHYELSATFRFSDDPASCWDGTHCDSLHLTLDKIGGVPGACQYADENTVALTIVGGPQAGAHTLDAFGSSASSGPAVAFEFGASTGPPVAQQERARTGGVSSIYLYASTSYLDPELLPTSLPVTVISVGSHAAAAGGLEVLLSYYEQTDGYSFFAESAESGNFVVQEIDLDHIAGTLNVTVSGTEYNAQYPGGNPAQRTLTGGYFVTANALVAARAESGVLTGALRRMGETFLR